MNPGPFIIVKLERKLKRWLGSLFDLRQGDAKDAFLGTAEGHARAAPPERPPSRDGPGPLGLWGLSLSAGEGRLSFVGSQVYVWGAMGMTKGIVESFVAKEQFKSITS